MNGVTVAQIQCITVAQGSPQCQPQVSVKCIGTCLSFLSPSKQLLSGYQATWSWSRNGGTVLWSLQPITGDTDRYISPMDLGCVSSFGRATGSRAPYIGTGTGPGIGLIIICPLVILLGPR